MRARLAQPVTTTRAIDVRVPRACLRNLHDAEVSIECRTSAQPRGHAHPAGRRERARDDNGFGWLNRCGAVALPLAARYNTGYRDGAAAVSRASRSTFRASVRGSRQERPAAFVSATGLPRRSGIPPGKRKEKAQHAHEALKRFCRTLQRASSAAASLELADNGSPRGGRAPRARLRAYGGARLLARARRSHRRRRRANHHRARRCSTSAVTRGVDDPQAFAARHTRRSVSS